MTGLLVSMLGLGCAGDGAQDLSDDLPDARHSPIIRYVDNVQDLMDHIGDEHTIILLAGGDYVIPACLDAEGDPDFLRESTDPTCGQMTLGHGSALLGTLKLEVEDGVPTGQVVRSGPRIDCSALQRDLSDGWGWYLSCLAASDGWIQGVAIENGDEAVPAPPGTVPPPGANARRNGIRVDPGGTVHLRHVALEHVRRGVFMVAETGASTTLDARALSIVDTELAGTFGLMAATDEAGVLSAVQGATISTRLASTWLDEIGFHPMLTVLAGGSDNTFDATYQDNQVHNSPKGVSLLAEAGLVEEFSGGPSVPIVDNTAHITVEGGTLAGAVGLSLLQFNLFGEPSWDSSGNDLTVEMRDVTFEGNALAVDGFRVPWGRDDVLLDMTDNTYVGSSPGIVSLFDLGGWDPPVYRIAGSAEDFEASNTNFDISGVLGNFEE